MDSHHILILSNSPKSTNKRQTAECFTSKTDRSIKMITKSLTSNRHKGSKSKLGVKKLTIANECPGNELCANYQSMITLKFHIQKLNNTIDQLTKTNQYFNFALSQKERLIKKAMDSASPRDNIFHSPKLNEVHRTQESLTKMQLDALKEHKSTPKVLKQLSSVKKKKSNERTTKVRSDRRAFTESNLSMIKPQSSLKDSMGQDNTAQLNHYDNINKLLKKNQKSKPHSNLSGVSFLALSDSKLKEIANNESINQISKMASSDELFAHENKDKLIQYCDVIGSIAKDFQSSVSLIQRIKLFLTSSVQLSNSLLTDNSIEVFISSTAQILACEKAALFLYDTVSDKLISHTTEGRGFENRAKVAKDKGEVGECFMKGKRIMMDNGLKEGQISNKDVKLRNMICYPLFDVDGDIFGVIQGINKHGELFNANDIELLEVFSKQASAILQNMKNNETISTQLLRLRLLVNYSVEITLLTSAEAFAKKTEQLLMFLFSSPASVVYFCDDKGLFDFKTKQYLPQTNIGIVSYVVKKKECYGCSRAPNCKYYNSIIDLSTTDSLITYPIVDKSNDVVIGVLQTQFFSKLSDANEKPKKNEMVIFSILEQCFVSWYERNKIHLCFN